MLLELSIRNLAIIDAVHIVFAEGFNVMTGETGAGKSIVVDAVNLVLGQRADHGMVQAGADRARVEALFDIAGNAALAQVLEEQGLEAEEDQLLLVREIYAAGRTVCRVGGSIVPLAVLRQVAATLLDMPGEVAFRYIFSYYVEAYTPVFKEGLQKQINQGLYRQNLDLDLASFYYLTSGFLRALYAKKHGIEADTREMDELNRKVNEGLKKVFQG